MQCVLDPHWWSRSEAVLYLVLGRATTVQSARRVEKLRAVEAWLSDHIHCPMPTDSQQVAVRLKLFVAAASEELAVWTTPNPRLPPAVWMWFAWERARGAVAPRFQQALEAWVTQLMLTGKVPIAQFREVPLGKGKVRLDQGLQDVRNGVQLSTLLLRPFDASYAQAPWRCHVRVVAAPRSKPSPPRSGSHSPDSKECQALLLQALQRLAQRTHNITRTRAFDVETGSKRFRTQVWNRSELLDQMETSRDGSALARYGRSTLLRALSSLVESRRGRPPKPSKPPAG